MVCLFIFLVFFEEKKVLILMKSNLSICFFIISAFDVISKKSLPNSRSERFTPVISSKSFTVLVLTFISMMAFDLIFGLRYELMVQIYPFIPAYPIVSTSFVEKTILSPIELSWHLCQNQLTMIVEVYF